MSSLSLLTIHQKLAAMNIGLLTKIDLQRIFSITNENTTYKLLQRLTHKGVLERVRGGLYVVVGSNTPVFTIANAAYGPSYVSLETALSLYGILSQIPFIETSVTVKRHYEFTFHQTFEYVHMSPQLFFGFVKEQSYVIATPEKALVDLLYLASKGLRSAPLDELDYSRLNRSLFRSYCKQIRSASFLNYCRSNKIV